jgi:hypothetical protein
VPDPAEQLARLYAAGFNIETFEKFPKAIGVVREGCIVLLSATPGGLVMIGTPGWRMGDALGVLVNEGGRRVFRWKDERVEATPERLQALRTFHEELHTILSSRA